MTNEQAKQEAIKKAYGNKWDLVKKLTPKNGNDDHDLIYNGFFKLSFLKLNMGSHLDYFPTDKFHYSGSNIENGYVLPLSIQGLHGNNGWIRIEPDGSNLPDIHIDFIWLRKSDRETKDNFHINGHSKGDVIRGYSHYKPITPELKPIY